MPDGGVFELKARTVNKVIHPRDRRQKAFVSGGKESIYVEIAVRDSGIGIEPEAKKAIFDPFFTTKPKGTGLGLSIVYRIIEEHRGEISVDSELGKGTIFKLLLPTEE